MSETIQDKSVLDEIKHLLQKAKDAEHRNTEESLKIALKALELTKKHKLLNPMASSYVRIGRCHWINGNSEQAIEMLQKGLEICDEVQNEYVKVQALIGLGNVHIDIELFDQSMSYYKQALTISERYDFIDLNSRVLNNLGTVQEELGNIDQALVFFNKCLEEAMKIDDSYACAIAQINISNMLFELKEVTKSEKYIYQAIEYGEENNKTLLLAHAYYSLGKIHISKNKFEDSVTMFYKATKMARESMDQNILFNIYLELGNLQINNKNYDKAEKEYLDALDVANDIGLDKLKLRVFDKISMFYKLMNNNEKALIYFQNYLETNQRIQENRLKERSKIIEYQSRLSSSIEETLAYQKLSDELKKSYNNLSILNEIGQTMTSTHKISDILSKLYENINSLMSVDSLSVGIYDSNEDALRMDLSIEDGKPLVNYKLSCDNKKSLMVYSYLNNITIKLGDAEKEHSAYIEGVVASRGKLMPSAMYTPLIVENETIGVFTVQNKEKNVYSEADKILLQTLASYLAISLRNATKTRELAKLNRVLKAKSEQDGLTGIPNRRLFDEQYNDMWLKAIDYHEMIGVMIIDIDNFKSFNDKYGHLVGDEVVKHVARVLNQQKTKHDFVARYGGDEFVVVLPKATTQSVKRYEKRVREVILGINQILGIKDEVKISIGVALGTSNIAKDKGKLVYVADNQLYESKSLGKNTISIKVLD